jgi:hypothetical protein
MREWKYKIKMGLKRRVKVIIVLVIVVVKQKSRPIESRHICKKFVYCNDLIICDRSMQCNKTNQITGNIVTGTRMKKMHWW